MFQGERTMETIKRRENGGVLCRHEKQHERRRRRSNQQAYQLFAPVLKALSTKKKKVLTRELKEIRWRKIQIIFSSVTLHSILWHYYYYCYYYITLLLFHTMVTS